MFVIDGEASLVKGVYNRIMRDYGLDAKSFKITTYNDAPAGSGLGTVVNNGRMCVEGICGMV